MLIESEERICRRTLSQYYAKTTVSLVNTMWTCSRVSWMPFRSIL